MCLLWIESRFSARAVSALNYWAICPAPPPSLHSLSCHFFAMTLLNTPPILSSSSCVPYCVLSSLLDSCDIIYWTMEILSIDIPLKNMTTLLSNNHWLWILSLWRLDFMGSSSIHDEMLKDPVLPWSCACAGNQSSTEFML